MQRFKMKKGIAWLLVVAMLFSIAPSLFAAEGDPLPVIGKYVEVDANGEKVPGREFADPVKTEMVLEDGEMEYSKSILPGTEDNTFDITLSVKTPMDVSTVPSNASVLLLLDVSDSMDDTLVSRGEETRWQVLKAELESFIETLLANEGNQVSIVIWGGKNDDSYNGSEYMTICGWTSNAITVIGTFSGFDYVSPSGAVTAGGSVADSLRNYYMKDNNIGFGATNAEAAFTGAMEQLANKDMNSANQPFVVYLSDGVANKYFGSLGINTAIANQRGIAKAEAMKTAYPNAILYTIGLSSDVNIDSDTVSSVLKKTDNPAVDRYFYAGNGTDLSETFQYFEEVAQNMVQAETVTDPMSDWVILDESSLSDTTSAAVADNAISWDLRKATPVFENGAYSYTLTYTVTLNTEAPGFDWDTYYPTNKQTTLTYLFGTSVAVSDDLSKVKVEEGTYGEVEFLIPTVRGVKPEGSITKTSSVSEVRPGGTYSYTIEVMNSGEATWKNVVVTDELDQDIRYIDSQTGSGDISVKEEFGSLIISFGDIAPDTNKMVLITVRVGADAPIDYEITNAVLAESDNDIDRMGEDPDPPVVVGPNGSITKIANSATVERGERYTYTITATNNGNERWNNVTATDTLDSNLVFVSSVSADGVTFALVRDTIQFHFQNINPGTSKSVTITVEVSSSAPVGYKIPNTIVVLSNGDEITAEDPVKPVVVGPKGSISKASGVTKVKPGEEYVYTITASNAGNAAWENIVVKDTLDAKLSYVTFNSVGDGDSVTVTHDSGVLTISFGKIPAGGKTTVVVTVKVDESAPHGYVIPNALVATSDNDFNKTAEDPDPPTVVDPILATVNLVAQKKLDNDVPGENTFSFELKDINGYVWATEENDAQGNISFPTMTFNAEGTFEYTISEVKGNGSFEYDASIYRVRIDVTYDETNGKFEADVQYLDGEAVFNNTTVKKDPTPVTVTLPEIQKVVSGDTPSYNAAFTFELKAVTPNAPMPNGSENGLKTASIAGNGTTSLGTVTYTEAGTYVYTIKETDSKFAGYTYDTSVYTLTVVVEEKDGALTATSSMTKSGSVEAVQKAFVHQRLRIRRGRRFDTLSDQAPDRRKRKSHRNREAICRTCVR